MAEALEIPPPPPGFNLVQGIPPPPPGFTIIGGGAAVGNQNIAAQGARALKPDQTTGEALTAIGGAGAIGGAIGAAAPEILSAASAGARALPFPGAPAVATGLDFLSRATRAAGRPIAAISGAVSGAVGETSGQLAEEAGASQTFAEAARFAGGGIGAAPLNAAKDVLKKYGLVPALGLVSKYKHEFARKVLSTLEGTPESIGERERRFIADVISEMRGASGKTDVPLENVGSIMGAEGKRLMSASELQMANALRKMGSVGSPAGYPAGEKTLADIGGELQTTILARNKAALEARSAQYTATEKMRDSIVSSREEAGQYVNNLPEYNSLVAEIKSQLDNSVAMKRSPSIQASYRRILNDITNPETTVAKNPPNLSGQNLNFQEIQSRLLENKPVTFQAIDDLRRELGDVFRGKPSEGFKTIDSRIAENVYGKLSDIQKQFAGGATGPQAKLLNDYAAATPGLEKFSSKLGKKVTALDQYREGQFPDPSTIPGNFFKTRASVQALQELTGNKTQVQAAALEFVNKELAGKDASTVRGWMSKNSEWLSEVPATRTLVDKYASRLEGAERSMKNAQDFAKQAEVDSNLLTRNRLPAQRAIDLINSGDTELWSKVAPVIVKSPQAKTEMVNASRQVLADMAESNGTIDFFNRKLRPFLESTDIATKTEMDIVAKQLFDIQTKNIPELEKLGFIKRTILNSFGGYSATLGSRAAVGGYGLLANQIPPQLFQGQQP